MLRGSKFSVRFTSEYGGWESISTFRIYSNSFLTAAWASSNWEKEVLTFKFCWLSVSPTICCSRDLMVNYMNFCFSQRLIELNIFLVLELTKNARIREGVCVSKTKLPRRTKYTYLHHNYGWFQSSSNILVFLVIKQMIRGTTSDRSSKNSASPSPSLSGSGSLSSWSTLNGSLSR